MARKKAVRRENGQGTVEKTNSKKNPFKAKVPVGTKIDKNGKTQAVYKTLGTFPTREEAENALADFSRTPYDITNSVKTFADLIPWMSLFIPLQAVIILSAYWSVQMC